MTDIALIILGPAIPLLTYVFLHNYVAWQRDRAADAESAAADAHDQWHADWAWWSRRAESPNRTIRRTAIGMQAFLQDHRPS